MNNTVASRGSASPFVGIDSDDDGIDVQSPMYLHPAVMEQSFAGFQSGKVAQEVEANARLISSDSQPTSMATDNESASAL